MAKAGIDRAAAAAPGTATHAIGAAQSGVIVVFHGFGHGIWARLFGRPGFRHCFVCLAHQGAWLRLDFQNGAPSLEMVCADTFDLAAFYRAAGLTVVIARPRQSRSALLWPFMSATCVGAVKKVLGIAAPFVQTPFQLHAFLTKNN